MLGNKANGDHSHSVLFPFLFHTTLVLFCMGIARFVVSFKGGPKW